MRIDPRILRRRLEVAEDEALARVRRSLMALLVMGGIGIVAWFVVSPYMSVATLEVQGAVNGDVEGILAREKLAVGRPLVAVRVDQIEKSLLADPWIKSASVKLVFPTRVEVNLSEREGVAWLWLGGRWGLLADDGVLLEYSDAPEPVRSIIAIPVDELSIGSAVTDEAVLGALEFARALPQDVDQEILVQLKDDELWGLVGDRPVRLGLPVHMAAKAVSLTAVIAAAPEGLIDMTAPERPALRTSEPVKGTPDPVINLNA